MDMVDLSRTHRFHGPREQVLSLVSACRIVKVDESMDDDGLIPVLSQVVGVFKTNAFVKEVYTTELLEWSVTPKMSWETF